MDRLKPMGRLEKIALKAKYFVKSQLTGANSFDDGKYMTLAELKEGMPYTDKECDESIKKMIADGLILRVFDKKKNEMGYVLNIDKIDEIEKIIKTEVVQ